MMTIASFNRHRTKSAFTLVEVLIVIGLITLISTLVIMNGNGILRGLGDDSIDKTLRKAVREGRFQAGSIKGSVELRFDEEKAAFLLIDENGNTLQEFPTEFADDPNAINIEFSQRLPGKGLTVNQRADTSEVDAVYFRPDRSSTPFEAKISYDRQSFTLEFDPFSDIVLKDSRAK